MDAQALAKTQDGHTRVRVEKLTHALKLARDKHIGEFVEALDGWRIEYREALSKFADAAHAHVRGMEDNGGDATFDAHVQIRGLPRKPVSYEREYDRIIRKMEFTEDGIVWLKHDDFHAFVMDEWDWKSRHDEDHANYSVAIRRKR